MEKKNNTINFIYFLASVVLTAVILFSYKFVSKEWFPDFYSTATGRVSSFGETFTSTSGYYTENSADEMIFSIASGAVFSFSFDIIE